MPRMLTPRTAQKQIGMRISEEAFKALVEIKKLRGGSPTSTAEAHTELLQRIKPEKYEHAVSAFLTAGQ